MPVLYLLPILQLYGEINLKLSKLKVEIWMIKTFPKQ